MNQNNISNLQEFLKNKSFKLKENNSWIRTDPPSHLTMKNSVIGTGCNIGENVFIMNSIIGNNISVPDTVSVKKSIILDSSQIKKGDTIENGLFLQNVQLYCSMSHKPEKFQSIDMKNLINYLHESSSTSTR